MPTDEDRLRALRAFDLDDIPDRRSGGENTNDNIGTAMASVVRKVMTTDESMKPEIDAVAARAREYRMRFVRYMTEDAPTQKID